MSGTMTEDDPIRPDGGNTRDASQTATRKPRGIRFSDSEWEEVRQAAEQDAIPVAEFVRERILTIVRGRANAESGVLPAELAPLIQRTFRYTYMLATKMRDDMLADEKGDELDHLIKEARVLQDSLTSDVSPHRHAQPPGGRTMNEAP